jgi:hypothetical protein
MKIERMSYECERCQKRCNGRVPDPSVEVARPYGAKGPRLICIRCVNEIRRAEGGPPPAPSKKQIAKADLEKQLDLYPGIRKPEKPKKRGPAHLKVANDTEAQREDAK